MWAWGLVAGVGVLSLVLVFRRRRDSAGGSPTVFAAVVLLSTLLYGVGLVAFTVLPLPAGSAEACADGGRDSRLMSLITFAEARNMARDMGPSFLASPSFLQILSNVALFVPLGLLIGWRTRWPMVTAVAVGLATSLLIELTQATGVWWSYDCAYRFGDLQDLVTNTSGAVVGWLIGRRIVRQIRWPDAGPEP